jgi:uncharacterized protein
MADGPQELSLVTAMEGARHTLLEDGRRLHLNHGPIDLIVEAFGAPGEVAGCYRQAIARFETILSELVGELPLLRQPVAPGPCPVRTSTAHRMWRATASHLPQFVTPMAAVAGAVADEVLAAMVRGRDLRRAYVNNGGDIALHLAPPARSHESGNPVGDGENLWVPAFAGTSGGGMSSGLDESFRVGLVVDPGNPRSPGAMEITHAMPVRGIATSGRHGRSLSLGIADSVTVLAATAAEADAAATLIANAVDLPGHGAVRRDPACSLDPDSDLGERLVTVDLGPLSAGEIDAALDAGLKTAEDMIDGGRLHAAVLVLGQAVRLAGHPGAVAPQRYSKETRVHA